MFLLSAGSAFQLGQKRVHFFFVKYSSVKASKMEAIGSERWTPVANTTEAKTIDFDNLRTALQKRVPLSTYKESFAINKIRTTEKPSLAPAVQTRLIKLRLVKHQTRNGKVANFSAMVVAGNGAGGVGFGFGKDAKSTESLIKAGKIAERNMEFFERFQGRTIFHPVTVKFKATIVMAKPAPASKIKAFIC